jgi:hypothetical protein
MDRVPRAGLARLATIVAVPGVVPADNTTQTGKFDLSLLGQEVK